MGTTMFVVSGCRSVRYEGEVHKTICICASREKAEEIAEKLNRLAQLRFSTHDAWCKYLHEEYAVANPRPSHPDKPKPSEDFRKWQALCSNGDAPKEVRIKYAALQIEHMQNCQKHAELEKRTNNSIREWEEKAKFARVEWETMHADAPAGLNEVASLLMSDEFRADDEAYTVEDVPLVLSE